MIEFILKSSLLEVTAIAIIVFLWFRFYIFWTTQEYVKDLSDTVFNKEHLNIKANYKPSGIYPTFPNFWYPIAQSRELKPGQVKPIYIFEKDLVVFRTVSGKVHVLDAYCPHQGTHLGIGGNVLEEGIICPFHRWTFDGEGVCTSIPGLKETEIGKIKIDKWKSLEVNQWIFVWYHNNDRKPVWKPPEMEYLKSAQFSAQSQFEVYCHFMDMYGNVFDPEHIDLLHSVAGISPEQILRKGKLYDFVKKLFRIEVQFMVNEVENDLITSRKWPQMSLCVTPVIFGYKLNLLASNGVYTFCPPMYYMNMETTVFRIKNFTTIALIPISPMKLQIYVCNYHVETSFISKLIAKLTVNFTLSLGMAEFHILNNKKFLKRPHLVKMDRVQNKFFRWFVANFYDENKEE